MPIVMYRIPRWKLDGLDVLLFFLGLVAGLVGGAILHAKLGGGDGSWVLAAGIALAFAPVAVRRGLRKPGADDVVSDGTAVNPASVGVLLAWAVGGFAIVLAALVMLVIAFAVVSTKEPLPFGGVLFVLAPSPLAAVGAGLIALGRWMAKRA